MAKGYHILPQDDGESFRFTTERGPPRILDFRKGQLDKLEAEARRPFPALRKTGDNA